MSFKSDTKRKSFYLCENESTESMASSTFSDGNADTSIATPSLDYDSDSSASTSTQWNSSYAQDLNHLAVWPHSPCQRMSTSDENKAVNAPPASPLILGSKPERDINHTPAFKRSQSGIPQNPSSEEAAFAKTIYRRFSYTGLPSFQDCCHEDSLAIMHGDDGRLETFGRMPMTQPKSLDDVDPDDLYNLLCELLKTS